MIRRSLDVRRICRALDRGAVHAVFDHHRRERCALEDRLPDDRLPPGHRSAVASQSDAQPVHPHRPVVAAPHVVFARPDGLDRRAAAGRLHHVDGLRNEVARRRGPPAKPAAEEHRVDLHLLRFQARDLRGVGLVHGLELRARPDLAAVGRQARRAVHRLHRGVREVRYFVLRLERLRGRSHRGFSVPRRGRLDSGFPGHRAKIFAHPDAVQIRAGAEVPIDVERVAAEFRSPEVLGDDRDAGGDLNHGLHARDGFRTLRPEALHPAAKNGRTGHERRQHPGQPHVHAELCLAGNFRRRVEAPGGFAQDLPVLWIFEPRLARRRHLLRRVRKLAEREPVTGMHDVAVFGAARGRIDFPLGGRRPDEHLARHRSDLPVTVELRPGRRRASRHLHAVGRVRVGGRGRSVFDADLRPVTAELFGNQHRKRRPDALPHLGVRKKHGDALVGTDAQKRIRVGQGLCRRTLERRQPGPRSDVETDDETGGGLQELTPVEARPRAHAFFPARSAARCTAARIRW